MSCAAQRGKFPPWTGTVAAVSDGHTPEPVREVNAWELAEKLLTYFDRYQLGSVAPIVAELEQALDAEYRRGVEEAEASVVRRARGGRWKDSC